MNEVKTGDYYWVKLKDSTWEPAYRFRSHSGVDVWLVIATNENVHDDKVEQVGPKLKPPSQ